MGRKRKELGAEVDAKIEGFAKRGITAEAVAKKLRAEGVEVSTETVSRRMRESRGRVRATRVDSKRAQTEAPAVVDVPSSPEDIPDDASESELRVLLAKSKEAITKAENEQNLTLLGQMIRVAAQISEMIRKSTPTPPPDIDAQPDMIAAAKRARESLHKLIDSATGAP